MSERLNYFPNAGGKQPQTFKRNPCAIIFNDFHSNDSFPALYCHS